MNLTKDQILSASDLPTQTVDIPEWGGSVIVSTMDGVARDAFSATVAAGQANSAIAANVIVATAVDENGNQIFTAADVAALQKKSSAVLNRIADAAMTLNGIGQKATEEAGKNSAAAPSGDSGSVSRATSENQ